MSINTLLFDLDGTLLNSLPMIGSTFRHTFDQLGIPWGNGEILKTVGLPLRDVAVEYAHERAEEFLTVYGQYQSDVQESMLKAYPGTIETLEKLHDNGYRLGLVTSKRRSSTMDGLAISGLGPHLEVIVTVDDISQPKPHPEPVLKALELMELSPLEAIYVGDSWYDILTGKNAGVLTIGVTWGMATWDELHNQLPDYIVNTWDELLATVDGICGQGRTCLDK
jgi:pyrophosphatase PpaX